MLKQCWKRVTSMVLVLALLVQISPLVARAEEAYPANPECDPQSGMSALYEYTPFEAGSAGTAYVNTYLGSLHLRRSDLSLGGERMPVTIEFYFDPVNDTSNNPYGAGWTTTYNQLLSYDQQTSRYAYKNENGTWIYFVDSGERSDSGSEIWVEDVEYGIGEVGVELFRSAQTSETDYTSMDLVSGDVHYSFDSTGRLTKMSSGANQILISYVDDTNAIATITDSVGRVYTFNYSSGFLSSITCKDSTGKAITNGTNSVTISYTVTDHLLTTVTRENGDVISYQYDSAQRLQSVSNVDRRGYTFTYSENSPKVTCVTAKAAMGTTQEATGTETVIEHPTLDSVTITSDTVQEEYTFDQCGRAIQCEMLTATSETTHGTSDDGAFECVYGMNMTYGYVTDDDGTVSNTIVDVEAYDADGVIEDTDKSGDEAPQASDPTKSGSNNTTYTKDAYGNILSETYTQGKLQQTNYYTYSEDGNYLTSHTDENGNTVEYQYNQDSGLLEYLIDANGNKTEYSYNAVRELQAAHLDVSNLTNGSGMNAQYNYTKGLLTTLIYGAYQYHFQYDIWGNVLSVRMNGSLLVSYDYGDHAHTGQVQTMTYGNGQKVFYNYNSLGQVVNVGYTNQLNRFTYTYASDGSLTQIQDNIMKEIIKYTDSGFEIRTTSNQLIYSYTGDENGNSTESFNGLTFHTSSNSTNNTTTITNEKGTSLIKASRAYDALDRLSTKTVIAGFVKITNSYNYRSDKDGNSGNLVDSYHAGYVVGDTKQTSLTFNYTYDGNGNITGVTQTEHSGKVFPNPDPQPTKGLEIMSVDSSETVTSSYTSTYTYDEAGQLVEAVDGETSKIYRYKYDNSGNIIRMEEVERDEAGNEVTTSNKTFSYTNGILSSYRDGNTTVTYRTDAMGNPIAISTGTGTQSLTWGEGRMLLRVKQNASNYSQYTYNADGLRIKKDVMKDGQLTTSKYVWGNNGLAGIITNNMSSTTTVVPLYDSSGEAIGFSVKKVGGIIPPISTEPVVYTYVKNLQGDVIRILDKTGRTVVSYTYDPWGVPTVTGDTELAALNPCSYRGYDYDEETGYYYLQSRYYDPEIGRFLNSDDAAFLEANGTILGYNLFSYCCNSPISIEDKSGHFGTPIQWACAIIGALVGIPFGKWLANKLGYYSGPKYLAIRAGAIIGGAVLGWFSGKLITKLAAMYIKSHPEVYVKIISRYGYATLIQIKSFLGLNGPLSSFFQTLLSRLEANRINHILLPHHNWRMIGATQWKDVQRAIIYVLCNGASKPYKADSRLIYARYRGHIIEIQIKIVNGIIKIVDGWVVGR